MTAPVVVVLTESAIRGRYHGVDSVAAVGEHGSVATSVLDLIDDNSVAVGGGAVQVTDAIADALRVGFDGVGAGVPAEVAVVPYPSRWGTARREALVAGIHRVAREAVVVQTSVAVATAAQTSASRIVVVECTGLSLTASYVIAESGGYRAVACEYEPNIGGGNDGSSGAIATIAAAVAEHRAVELVLVTGPCDIDGVRAAAEGRFGGTNPEVVEIDEKAIAAALETAHTPELQRLDGLAPALTRMPPSAWLEPAIRQRRDARFSPKPLVIGVAVVAAVVGVGVFGVWRATAQHSESADASASASASVDPTTEIEAVPASDDPTPSTSPIDAPVTVTAGRITVQLPAGWRERQGGAVAAPPRDSRVEFVPAGGTDRRVIVMQNTLRQGADYDAVAATLTTRIADPAKRGKFSDLQRDAQFGGRTGLAYSENPDENSQVKWHVIVDRDMQVSVGCQYLMQEWDAMSGDCEQIVRSVEVAP